MKNLKSIYFLGIGGIGMSALARYFKLQGARVSGYDRTPSPLTDELASEGIDTHFDDNPDLIPEDTELVIYTPAIPVEHAEFRHLKGSGIPMKKRSEVLGMITEGRKTIAVAGTHGKTTVTTFIAHILKSAGADVTAFLGGISKNYGTNFIAGSSGEKAIMVVEADEFDRSFLTLWPDIAVITSVDADHLDIYGDKSSLGRSFTEFSSHIKKNGHLLVRRGLAFQPENINGFTIHDYAKDAGAGYSASNLHIEEGKYVFDLLYEGKPRIINLSPGLTGLFNVDNTIAAAAVADILGIDYDRIRKAVADYEGVVRRFDFRIKRDDFVYIDDYAHHPAEISACIEAVRKLYPAKKLTGVFQPHLFTRTKDFAIEFAESLSALDKVILLKIYPAREKPIPGVNSQMLLDRISIKNKMICHKTELIPLLLSEKPEVLVTMGAGDIDRLVEPITEAFAI